MNKQIRRLGVGLLACYVLLFVQLNVLQVVQADSYNANPLQHAPGRARLQPAARRHPDRRRRDPRPVVPSNDRYNFQRVYPTKDLFAGVTGYFAFTFGSDGVERTYNDVLAGRTDQQRVISWNSFFEDQITTGDVTLTLRADVQAVAQRRSATGRARSSRSTRATGRSSPCGATRRTTRTCSPRTTSRPPRPRGSLARRAGQAARARDLPGALLPRLDVQGRDRRPPGCRAVR